MIHAKLSRLFDGFSALTLLVEWQEGHPACKNWVVGCWHGYLPGPKCRFAYGPADATATQSLAPVNPDWFYLFLTAHLGSLGQKAIKQVSVYRMPISCTSFFGVKLQKTGMKILYW